VRDLPSVGLQCYPWKVLTFYLQIQVEEPGKEAMKCLQVASGVDGWKCEVLQVLDSADHFSGLWEFLQL
jgi:hypothetical protein